VSDEHKSSLVEPLHFGQFWRYFIAHAQKCPFPSFGLKFDITDVFSDPNSL